MSPKRSLLISILIAVPTTIMLLLMVLSSGKMSDLAGFAYFLVLLLVILIAVFLTKGRRIIHCSKKVEATIISREEIGGGTRIYLHLETEIDGSKVQFVDKDTNEAVIGNIGDKRIYYISKKDLQNIRKETRKIDLIELAIIFLITSGVGASFIIHMLK